MKNFKMAAEDSIHERLLQIMAVAAMFFTQVALFLIMPPLTCYIILATKYWWICLLYLAWSFIYHKGADETGEWRSKWVRSWSWWVYAKNYFPLKLVKLPWGDLDKKRNYLFCYFPHGILCAGSYLTSATNVTEFQEYFPHHKSYIHTIGAFFRIPIIRELGLSMGGLEASKKSLNYILGNENGGNISALIVGGAHEAYYCNPGVHKIVYKKRKGFIKIALTQGAPLVPVYVFGENELFSQSEFHGFFLQKLRDLVKKLLGVCLVFPVGRKEMLGIVPRRRPLTAVVGEPVEVQKTENPTQEQIDDLHQLFQTKLVELFESQKKYYLEDHETAHLEIC